MSARLPATPERIWALLVDVESWPVWGTVDELVPERSANLSSHGRDGIGAVRAFRTGRIVTSERIVELHPYQHFVYADAENPYLSNYRAEVELRPVETGGTAIRWHGTYDVRFGLRLMMRPVMNRTMRRTAVGLAGADGLL